MEAAALERGHSIDRFVVIGLVGRGGMGEVYAAYDPELDRKVAIKLLRARSDSADGRARLLREAQAIAKLSHPNVVVVYDVGTFGDSVFIAMEFVEGRTLTGWMHAQPRSRREIMQVFLAAGRGLAAAHAAGLVHRDFKPDNVMVTNDGQVRVMDFGLARQAGEGEATGQAGEAPADAPARTTSGNYLSVKVTQTGAMLGTPAYMAPEQFAMRATDARTDQFSFCVALYELLYGKRPFGGDTFLALMTAVTTGMVDPPPAKSAVPGWLRKVLLRGLAVDPDGRYPSMTAILAALETDPTVRLRRVGAGVGLLACAVLAVLGARRATSTQQAMCRGGAARWAGVWEADAAPSARKDAIRRAFAASGKTYAAQAFASAARTLDEYVGRWLAMYGDACEATHVRGEQSTEVLDLRMSCLQERLNGARALSEVLAHADGTVVDNAVAAAGALPGLDRCADIAALRSVIRPPEDEATRKRVEALRLDYARMVALRDAGHCQDAEAVAQALLPKVREVRYEPLLAETLSAAAYLVDQCLDVETGIARYREAFTVGLASGHDEVAATAAILLVAYLSDRAHKVDEARQWRPISRAALARAHDPPLLHAWYLVSEGILLQHEHDVSRSVEATKQAMAILEKVRGKTHYEVGSGYNTIGNTLLLAKRYEEALPQLDRGLDVCVKALGADHPFIAMVSSNRGEALNGLHRNREARAAFERAVAIWRGAHADPFFISFGLTGLGIARLGEGAPAQAIAPLEEALHARTEMKADPELIGETRFALARALWSDPGAHARAIAMARAARQDYGQVKSGTATVAAIDAWLAAPEARL